jgi:23S rRNA maturation-related 3'-5' exoribonuclease YhaM
LNKEGKTLMEITRNPEINDILKNALYRIWTPKTHHQFPKKTREEIATVMKLALKNTLFGQLPKDILLFICKNIGYECYKFWRNNL